MGATIPDLEPSPLSHLDKNETVPANMHIWCVEGSALSKPFIATLVLADLACRKGTTPSLDFIMFYKDKQCVLMYAAASLPSPYQA